MDGATDIENAGDNVPAVVFWVAAIQPVLKERTHLWANNSKKYAAWIVRSAGK